MRRLLVANRGEVARRIFRTCRVMGIGTVAVYSSSDASSVHLTEADMSVALPGSPRTAYLDAAAIVDAARLSGADAVHPGYGFLAEDPRLAAAVVDAGLVWVGPPSEVIAAMADKLEARRAAIDAGLTVTPGGEVGEREWAFPVLVKAVAGGGGRATVRVDDAFGLDAAVADARRLAASVFGDDRVYVEELVPAARHVEVQVLADTHGGVVHLGDRECSVQRRWQKVVEEAPAPGLDPGLRDELAAAACRLAAAVGYVGAGTVEFLVDEESWWFLEMNTRLQVEHPVTELVTGIDLVEQQVRVAAGERLPPQGDLPGSDGHAIEARLVAEDPTAGDLPQTGTVWRFDFPEVPGVRIDSGVAAGSVVGPDYDPLLGKVIAHGRTREEAAARLASALTGARVHGVVTNRDLLVRVLRHPDFLAGEVDTTWLDRVGDPVRHPLLAPGLLAPAAAAAAVALAARRRETAAVAGSIPAGFRNVPGPPSVRALDRGGERIDVAYRLATGEATVGGEALTVARQPDGSVAVVAEGVGHRFEVSAWPDRVVVDAAEGSADFVPVPRFHPPPVEEASGSLTAPVPGRVVAVAVEVGERVAAGDTLVVVESMKLEHTVVAAAPGTVTAILGVGGTVLAGQAVATVDTGTLA